MAEIADGLRLGGESIEVVVGRLDFHDATLGVLEQVGFGAGALASGLGEEPAVGEASSAVAELAGKQNRGLKGLTDSVEKTAEGRVKAVSAVAEPVERMARRSATYWRTVYSAGTLPSMIARIRSVMVADFGFRGQC